MSIESIRPSSRRALLAAGLAAGVAGVAGALGRPGPARASDGDQVFVGGEYTAVSVTKFDTAASGQMALAGNSNSNVGVYGSSTSSVGVYGASASGSGVAGYGNAYAGVSGESNTGFGVSGYTSSTDRPGVAGQASVSTGVVGYSGLGSVPAAKPKTGVYGQANQGSAGIGVRGHSGSGTGVYASSTTGIALRAVGRVKLDKCAGVTTITTGTNAVTVTPGIDLVSTSAVVATLQGNPAGTVMVRSVAINATANTFTIYLTANAGANVKVAWHVFG